MQTIYYLKVYLGKGIWVDFIEDNYKEPMHFSSIDDAENYQEQQMKLTHKELAIFAQVTFKVE